MTTEEILHHLSGLQIQTLHRFGKGSTAVRQFDVLISSVKREQDQRDIALRARQTDLSDDDEYRLAHAAERIKDARAINKESH